MKCQKCHQNEAALHVENCGDFCLNCYIVSLAAQLDNGKKEAFDAVVSMPDTNGYQRRFAVTHRFSPKYSVWEAREISGVYQFTEFVSPADKPSDGYRLLIQRIETCLTRTSLERIAAEATTDHAVQIGDGHYGIKPVGTARITAVPGSMDEGCLIIDGQTLSMADFGRLLIGCEGAVLDFQIGDRTVNMKEQTTVKFEARRNLEQLYERFEKTLDWFLTGNALESEQIIPCEDALYESISELKDRHHLADNAAAEKLAQRMITRLLAVEPVAGTFPAYSIQEIKQALEDHDRDAQW